MFRNARVPLLATLSFALAAALAAAQSFAASATLSPAMPRVNGPVDESNRVVLHGNVHPLAQARFDRGAVEDSFPAERLLLLLKRSDAQEAELQDLIQALHTPGDPSFHNWLKPDEFGRRFGPADSDVAAVIAWLQAHGFTVNQVHPGRGAIEFSGTAGQVREAFRTEIHRYEIKGEMHVANARDPEIPAALAPVIAGLAPMNNFHAKSFLKVLGRAEFNAKTHEAKPDWTYPNGPQYYPSLVVAPGDFAVQYNINPVYNGTTTGTRINGTGQSIAIVSASNIDLSFVENFQHLFGLPANLPDVVVDGSDPGQNGAATEAYLDVEWSGAAAPGAKVILYTSDGTALTDGLALAAYRAVGDDIAGVISTSYGECEAGLGQGGNAFWESTWEQAATQGQTAFVSSGDGGSAGCDDFDTQSEAVYGLAVNGISSTPFDVSVGGTDFYYSDYAASPSVLNAQIGSYWSGFPNGGTKSPAVSIQKTIPEQVWNNFFGYVYFDNGNPNVGAIPDQIVAGSGGRSSAALYPNGPNNPGVGYPKPTWQAGPGVPADKVRDVPDVSLFAANGWNLSFYPICAFAGDCVNVNSAANGGAPWITGVGGTSASSPAMAGILALVNQATNSWQGQADYFLYPIAKLWPDAFHDVTVGGNEVLCAKGSPNCVPSASGITKGFYVESGYPATQGYDLASGLGSVNVANLIHWWPDVTMKATTTTLGVNPTTFVHGKKTTITSTVAPKTGTGVPTGSISLASNDGVSHYAGIDYLYLNSSGKVDYPVDNLPGGTYQLTAGYGGDGTFAPSKSAPVTITVTPESDTLNVAGWAWNPYDLYIYPLTTAPASITVPYGAQLFLDGTPVSNNATQTNFGQPATGTVTFTDKVGTATVTSTQPLNTFGTAEWETGVFAVGKHTVAESYSGDASYKTSTAAAPLSFTVIKGSTYLTGSVLNNQVSPGGSVTVEVQLWTGYQPLYGAMPTGNVTVTLGNVPKSVPWHAFGPTGDSYLQAVVTFTGASVPDGILPVTASYAGDGNWEGSSANFGTVIALSTALTPTVILTTSLTSPLPAQLVTLTATVTGPAGKPAPTGNVVIYGEDNGIFGEGKLVNGKYSSTLAGSNFLNGTSVLYAYYGGDTNYNATGSNPVDITVSKAGFQLTTLNAEVTIAPTKTGTSTVVLRSTNAFDGVVTLTSTAPAGITVTLQYPAPTLSTRTTDVVTIAVGTGVKAGTYPVVIIGSANGGKIVHDALILVKVP